MPRLLWAALIWLCLAAAPIHAQMLPRGAGPAAVDAMQTLVNGMCTGCWADAGAAVGTAPTLHSSVWNCSAMPCPGAPSTAPTAADVLGSTGPSSIMSNWSGGAYDSDHKQLIVTGGGHLGYYDNALYAFDFPTLTWKRLSVPSSLIGFTKGTSATTFPDGQPVASHTYNGMVYVPGAALFQLGNCGRDTGGCAGDSYKVAPATLSPSAFNNWAAIASISLGTTFDNQIGLWDSVSGKIYLTGGFESTPLAFLSSPYTGTWTSTGGTGTTASGLETGAIQPGNQIVAAGGASFVAMSLSTGNLITRAFSGDATIPNANDPGFVWDSDAGKFVGWNGGTTVYTLDPSTYVFTAVSASVSNTVTPLCSEAGGCTSSTGVLTNGVFGRWQFLSDYHVFAAVNTIDDHTYVYKPPSF